jgi:predicted glutamine amidotransferase
MSAYLGPPIPVASVLEQGALALVKQGADHLDGFGIGWYPNDGQPEPPALASRMTFGRDEQLAKVARRARSSCVLAELKKLTNGEPDLVAGCQPFQHGGHLFLHEGELSKFHEVFERPLRARLKDDTHRKLKTGTCAELLFATWVDALGDKSGPDAVATALESMVNSVREIATAADAPAHFGVVVADGTTLVTLRTATHGTPPPMYTIVADEGAPMPKGGRVIATEPIFPGSWSSLDPHSLVIFTTE